MDKIITINGVRYKAIDEEEKIVQDNPIDKRELGIAEALIKKYKKIIKKKIEAEKSITNVHHILPRSRG